MKGKNTLKLFDFSCVKPTWNQLPCVERTMKFVSYYIKFGSTLGQNYIKRSPFSRVWYKYFFWFYLAHFSFPHILHPSVDYIPWNFWARRTQAKKEIDHFVKHTRFIFSPFYLKILHNSTFVSACIIFWSFFFMCLNLFGFSFQ